MNKNHILFVHPVVGNITFNDLIQDLNITISDLLLFQSIISDILHNSSVLSNEDISSLLNYISIDKLIWIRDLLQSTNEK